jgi:hypothetical protein
MGRTYPEIDDTLAAFLRRQHVFFVATAPLAADGHINLSPKGLNSFAIVDPRTVAYLDLTGSGVETIAHLRENGRVVLMFCAFDDAPKIVRLHGHGEMLPADQNELRPLFPQLQGARSIIRVRVERISDSCGYGVPLYHYEGERDQLPQWAERKGPEGVVKYQAEKNRFSIDGLPGLEPPSPRR